MATAASDDNLLAQHKVVGQFVNQLEQKLMRTPAAPTQAAPAAVPLSETEKKLRALELSFRSFCKGTVVVGNLSQGNYFCWHAEGSHSNLAPASDLMAAVADSRRDESLERMIRRKISDRLVDQLRQTTRREAPGLLLLMLSASPTLRQTEFSTFHNSLKERYGVDSTQAQLVKLYPAAPPLHSSPSHSVLTVRCGAQGEGANKRVTLLNFSEITYNYMRAFERNNQDVLIAPLLRMPPSEPDAYAAELRAAMGLLLAADSSGRSSIAKTIASHGILLVFLPSEARHQKLTLKVFHAAAKNAGLDLSSARGGVMLFSESVTGMR